jgi:iron complex outermembrane receptor protein
MRYLFILIVFFAVQGLRAQERDTASNRHIKLDEVVVTATRTRNLVKEVPARVQVIGREELESLPVSNIDDVLRSAANVNVNRSWGIFSKNSSVTMHGVPGSQRVLVLIDGVPKNKIGGGSVNWHNMNPDNIERIEVIKGPASSLYGNNAMGGVIQIITRRPQKRLEGSFDAFAGTYGTLGSSLNLGGSEVKNNKGIYWGIDGFYRQGKGYYLDPPEFLDPTDVPTNLKEFGGGVMAGYRFNSKNSLEVSCDYYDELRGAGLKVHLDDGSYESTRTGQVQSRYTGRIGRADVTALVYAANEDFYGQKESLNETGDYRLIDSYTIKKDQGIWATASQEVLRKNRVTIGTEVKTGSLDGEDIYRSSTDLIRFGSRMDVLGLFIQDEISLFKDKFKVIAGLRNDIVRFRDGHQEITEPTAATGFAAGFTETFRSNGWNAVSPKLAFRYNFNSKSGIYISAGTGFIPPDLKDLSQTGKIRKGFRLANPELRPEKLTNYELGYSVVIAGRVSLEASVYHSAGRDFQYMIGTGDSVETNGTLKPVLKPANIARIAVNGAELSARWVILKNLALNIAYAYNDSRITQFGTPDFNPDKDLTGKYLLEVSPHQLYAGLNWRLKGFTANLNCNYVGPQWFDDENTILLDEYFLLNMRITQTIKKQFRLHLDVQNILNSIYIDRKGQLSPGRYVTIGIQYDLSGRDA